MLPKLTRHLGLLASLAFCSTLFPFPALAQFDSAVVLGTIRDASGGVLRDVTVDLLNQGTGISARTKTDAGGEFIFNNVKIGIYSVTGEAVGFSKGFAKDIQVNVNARQRVDLALQIGAVAESVEVTAAASLLQTDSSERGQVVNRTAIVELPLNGRAYSDLALLTTGVVKSPSAAGREGSFVINGLRSTYNNYMLDGVDNNAYGTSNQGFANQVAQPSPEAVAEFKVITNNYSAEYGRSGGGTIAVSMKSGTNRFHGTAYEFLRNTALNAFGYTFGVRSPTAVKPGLQQNQFGLTFDGPIVKNKLFFFVDYEGFRNLGKSIAFSSLPSTTDRLAILPVAVANPLTGKVYAANTPIPASDTIFLARKVLSDLPAAINAGRSNNFSILALGRNYSDKFDAKVDGQINSAMSGFLRISQRKASNFAQSGVSGPSGGGGNGYIRALNQQAVGAFNWTLSPNSLLEARVGVSRTNAGKNPPNIGSGNMFDTYGISGLPTDPQIAGGLMPINLSGFTGLGRQSTNPQFQNPLSFDYKVNYTRIAGRQSFKIGYEFMAIRTQVLDVNPLYGLDNYAGAFSKPTCTLLGQAAGCTVPADNASYSVADFLFGLRSSYQLGSNVIGNYRQHEHFLYVQDDFRLTSKLTVNAGVRYEFATPRWERDNVLSNFDPASRSIIKAKSGSLLERTRVNPDRNNFAPRVGFAYSLRSNTVIRGGYGMSFVHQNRVGSADLLGINGPQVVIATVNQSNPLDPTFRTTQQGYPVGFASPSNFDPVKANITYVPADIPTPYVQSWFFSLQRTLLKDIVLDVGYVGNHSVALPIIADYNQANPQPTATANLSLQARRPIQGFAAITWFDPAGFSNYNALQVKLEKRFSGGLQFLNSFTYSKAIDNAAQSLDNSNGNSPAPQDVRNLAAEKGVSNYDLKFVDVLSGVYQLPVGRDRHFGASMPKVLDTVVGGWQLTAINTALSAPAVNLRAWNGSVPTFFQTVGNLNDFRGGEAFRPNINGQVSLPADQRTVDVFFNKSAVSLPTDPSKPFGNAGRNTQRGLPLNQLDLGIHKMFTIREDIRLQFRAEMFNAFNHTNFGTPTADINSAAFGTIRSTNMARQVQFALKLLF
jgi:hypothetical protein